MSQDVEHFPAQSSGLRASLGGASSAATADRQLGGSQDVHDVAILNDISFAFQSVHSMCLRFLHGADAFEVVEGHDLGADKAAGQVGLDLGGALHGVVPLVETPGPAFVLAYRAEDYSAHGLIKLANHLV